MKIDWKKKYRVGVVHLLCLLLLSVAIPLLAAFAVVYASDPKPPKPVVHSKLHTDAREFFDSIRLLRVKVTDVTEDTIYWTFEGNRSVEVGSFVYNVETVMPKDFKTKHEGVFWIHYCYEHKTAYIIARLEKP